MNSLIKISSSEELCDLTIIILNEPGLVDSLFAMQTCGWSVKLMADQMAGLSDMWPVWWTCILLAGLVAGLENLWLD